MRVDVAFKFARGARLVEAGRFASRALVEGDAQVPGLAGRFELGREGLQRRLAIGDVLDGNLLRWRFFTEVESVCA